MPRLETWRHTAAHGHALGADVSNLTRANRAIGPAVRACGASDDHRRRVRGDIGDVWVCDSVDRLLLVKIEGAVGRDKKGIDLRIGVVAPEPLEAEIEARSCRSDRRGGRAPPPGGVSTCSEEEVDPSTTAMTHSNARRAVEKATARR